MPRFVVLEHDWPFLHWDLMLEAQGVLRTWRLLSPPQGSDDVPAEPLGDHRISYLDYEGPFSGGRGSVRRWDAGTFDWREHAPERLRLHLHGEKLRGEVELAREGDGAWRLRVVVPTTPG